MAELSEIKKRVAKKIEEVMHRTYDSLILADAIIPLAQLPWEPPMAGEINAIFDTMQAADASTFGVVCAFVRRRNAAIQPKPVDPRREALIGFLKTDSWKDMRWTELADRILAAIDAAK
jgi:hypothetical protein